MLTGNHQKANLIPLEINSVPYNQQIPAHQARSIGIWTALDSNSSGRALATGASQDNLRSSEQDLQVQPQTPILYIR
jgi:hypothetical protein